MIMKGLQHEHSCESNQTAGMIIAMEPGGGLDAHPLSRVAGGASLRGENPGSLDDVKISADQHQKLRGGVI